MLRGSHPLRPGALGRLPTLKASFDCTHEAIIHYGLLIIKFLIRVALEIVNVMIPKLETLYIYSVLVLEL